MGRAEMLFPFFVRNKPGGTLARYLRIGYIVGTCPVTPGKWDSCGEALTMKERFQFHPYYFLATVFLFIIEVLIAIYVDDNFIRPYGGDYLVVILLFCFIKTFIKISTPLAAAGVLLFAYLIETLQYFDLVGKLGLKHSRIANIVIGNSFAWLDIIAYTLGIITIVIVYYVVKSGRKIAAQ
jgi:hypothetical protein